MEIRRHPIPREWTELHRDPVTGGSLTPPALMARFDSLRVRRREALAKRYRDPDLGAALSVLVRSCGWDRRPVRGRNAWTIVEGWDPLTAAWLRRIPTTVDAWDPLVRAVATCRRAAVTEAARDAEKSRKAMEATGRATGVLWHVRGIPSRAGELMALATTDEAYAHVATNQWRHQAHAEAAFAVLDPTDVPDVVDPGPAPEDDDEGGGKGAAITADDLDAMLDELVLPDGFEP